MSKLFLVRRALHTFVGPVTLSEFRSEFKRMNFGVQDEVSGHAGPWIMLENAERLARYYPEIARVVHDDMAESWRLSEHSARKIAGGPKAQKASRNETKRAVLLALACLAVAIGAALAAIWLAGGAGAFSSKIAENAVGITVAQVAAALNKSDPREFQTLMQNNQPEIVNRHNRTKEGALEWLPYLRAYAFLGDGHIDGISPKNLKGANAALAPVDCSEKAWRKRWRESAKNWNPFLTGKATIRAPWTRLLAWDPHWIHRRQPKGWIVPHNYYEACVQQAYRSFLNLRTDQATANEGIDTTGSDYQAIAARLKWLMDVSASTPAGPAIVPEKDNLLSMWTCFESAGNVASIGLCYESAKLSEAVIAYNDERIAAALLRLSIKGNGADPDVLTELRTRIPKLQAGDSFTRLEYSAELRFIRNSLKLENLPEPTTSEKTPADYSDVNFAK